MNATKNGQTIEEHRISLVGIKPVSDMQTSTIHEHVANPQLIPNRNSIVLGEMIARDLGGLEAGDRIDVKVEDRRGQDQVRQFTVSDIASIYGAFGFESYVHIDTLREMLDRDGETGGILVKLHNRDDTESFVQILRGHLKSDEYEIQTLEEADDDTLEQVKSGIAMIELIGLFSLTSAGIIIFTIQTMSVSSKTKQIGIIRDMGGQKKDVLLIFLIQGLVIGVIGAVMGTFVGIGFAAFMDTADFRFGDDVSIPLEINYDWNKITETALFAVLISIMGSLVPAFLATRVSPVEAMRN